VHVVAFNAALTARWPLGIIGNLYYFSAVVNMRQKGAARTTVLVTGNRQELHGIYSFLKVFFLLMKEKAVKIFPLVRAKESLAVSYPRISIILG
jgi:hypothetical protein